MQKYNYSLLDLASVWKKLPPVPGVSDLYRKEACGAWVYWYHYGSRDSQYGWEIDHIVPVAKGGSHSFTNLQVLHWQNNAAKGDGPLVCQVQARLK